MQQKVFNIPAGMPFAKTLAQKLLEEAKNCPEKLTEYKIFLPTRRACRVLRDTFLNLNEGKPILLPRMVPLGDVEEEELSLLTFGAGGDFLNIPAAISPLRRQVLLARLISANPAFGQGMDQALSLAQELGKFIDQVIIEGLDFSNLSKIVPEEFAAHWQITVDFLKIITENWPKILADEGLIDAAHRRNLLMEALSCLWERSPPQEHIIAAGSTGSIPATGRLLKVIASLPQGMIILPGLDQEMDQEGWEAVAESHPQYGLKQLLNHLNIQRTQVQNYVQYHVSQLRTQLAAEIMRPAQTTHHWKNITQRMNVKTAIEGLEYYTCQTQQEEAQVIALIIRETLESRDKIVALITPDRALARRVSALCCRWGIGADDSAGKNLRECSIGKFALLCFELMQATFNAANFLALLKHELCRLTDNYKEDLVELEKEFLRQDLLLPNLDVLLVKIEEKFGQNNKLYRLVRKILELRIVPECNDFTSILTAHLQIMENFAATKNDSGEICLWVGEEAEAAALFFTDLRQHSSLFTTLSLDSYGDILNVLLKGITVRTPYGTHPRVLILGQLEARLTSADVMILGGLNETVWPHGVKHDPWLSRPMRKSFGFPAEEKSIGLAAHDFVQGFCGHRVIMTRAARIDGALGVPSRWIQRLDTVLKAADCNINELSSKGSYLQWARSMDREDDFIPYEQPAPCPPLSARPDGISITKVDQWISDPYSVYAYYILRLSKLKALSQKSDVTLRGSMLHEILDRFCKKFPEKLPEDAQEQLIQIGKNVFEEMLRDENAIGYWWPRFLKIVTWYIQHERDWRMKAKFMETELEGNADIDVDGIPFNLHGKPDRIDRMQGGYGIIDYKSSLKFKAGKLKKGELPQLPLAAMILTRGGFDGKGLRKNNKVCNPSKKHIPASPVTYLGYWEMNGGKESGDEQAIDSEDVDAAIQIVQEGLKELVRFYRLPETPYISVPDLSCAPKYNNYEHLARLKEWAALDDNSLFDGDIL